MERLMGNQYESLLLERRLCQEAGGRKACPGYALGVIINVGNSRMNGNVWVRYEHDRRGRSREPPFGYRL